MEKISNIKHMCCHSYFRSVVPEAGIKGWTSNYIPHILWGVITFPCPWYLLLVEHSSFVEQVMGCCFCFCIAVQWELFWCRDKRCILSWCLALNYYIWFFMDYGCRVLHVGVWRWKIWELCDCTIWSLPTNIMVWYDMSCGSKFVSHF